ncbi:MAG: chloride channel protein [Parafannyhessea sp.]|uniref:chloride channel protein n=1 Tax=Parafannyhessea sp. TaxID=2847324 RepID=UPI003F092666
MRTRDDGNGEKNDNRVIDATTEPPTGATLARVSVALLLLALAIGFLVGFFCIGALWCVDQLQEQIWDHAVAAAGRWVALPLCVAGGLAVGAATTRLGFSLDTLAIVVARCRKEGGYRLPGTIAQTLLLFALPIAFGGAVGPEAGISGLVAALATSGIRILRRSGVAAVCDPGRPLAAALSVVAPGNRTPDRRYTRIPKVVLWGAAGLGFAVGAALFAHVFGPAGSLPRFDAIPYAALDAPAIVTAALGLALGCALALLSKGTKALLDRIEPKQGQKDARTTMRRALACGAILGVMACVLPDVLFSGQSATYELSTSWQTATAATLLATAVAKVVLSNVCVRSGWVGGEFFPLIFCGVSAGFALAAITGADPRLAVAVACAATVSGATGKWLLSTLVLALCFPPASLPVVAGAAYVSARLMAAYDRRGHSMATGARR